MSFDEILNKAGTDVTLQSSSATTVDSLYGDEKITYTSSSIKAVFQTVDFDEQREVYGIDDSGGRGTRVNAVCYVLPSSGAKETDRIIHDNETYEVVVVEKAFHNGTEVYRKLWLKKIES